MKTCKDFPLCGLSEVSPEEMNFLAAQLLKDYDLDVVNMSSVEVANLGDLVRVYLRTRNLVKTRKAQDAKI